MFFMKIFEERIIFFIYFAIENVMDLFCFYLKSLALKNEGVIAVFSECNVYDVTRPEVASEERANGAMLFVHFSPLF